MSPGSPESFHPNMIPPGMNPYQSPPPSAPTVPESAADEDPSHVWLREVYQGDHVPQLTLRAIITGMLIGGVMSISNLYVGLKTGWGLGVTITASIIAYAVFRSLEAVIPAVRRSPFSILENYTMSSAASAAGYMSSAGLVSAIPALFLANGRQLLWWELMLWLGSLSTLGVFMAVPLKRQLINLEKLPFPSGIATAETLQAMHSSGAAALSKARSLFAGALLGAVVGIWTGVEQIVTFLKNVAKWEIDPSWTEWPWKLPDAIPLLPGRGYTATLAERTGVNLDWLSRAQEATEQWLTKYTFGFEGSLVMVAAGAIMGIRVGISLLLGTILFWGVLGPWLLEQGYAKPGYRGILTWIVWPSTMLMVSSSLMSFALRWKTILKALSGFRGMVKGSDGKHDPLVDIEVPTSWFVVGTLVAGTSCVIIGHWRFEITWWMGILAVLMTFALSLVAARATGETDVTPIGALGKITQLMYGVIAPSNLTTNLMTACITSGAASHSADLLTDLKSGYLLGGNPRKQLISQLCGVLAGTLVCVPVYQILVKPEQLVSGELAAPAARAWQAVAELLKDGLEKLPPYTGWAMVIAAIVGVVITLAEEFAPPSVKRFFPSATGLGLAGVIPAFNSIMMTIGAVIAWLIAKRRPDLDEKYTISTSSGMIAGQTLVAVGLILLAEGSGLLASFWQ
ncbi:MAG: OPT/YSL family transporter [Planctomycetes bacterium]|nr:OPT/YSL family transporter [Planctomycetota bacterium]